MYTYQQAIEAIRARISGIWNNEQLQRLGPLSISTLEDIKLIIDKTEEQ